MGMPKVSAQMGKKWAIKSWDLSGKAIPERLLLFKGKKKDK